MTAEEKERSDAAWAVVLKNMKLVRYFARRFRVGESDEDDILQAGAIGFYLGVMNRDPGMGGRLSTYCQHPIIQHLRQMADSRRLVRVPRHAAKLASLVGRGQVDEFDLSPADAEIFARASAAMAETCGVATEGGWLVLHSIPAPDRPDPWEHEDVRRAVDSLPPGDRDVIRMRFYENLLLEEVAKALGMTREGARQRELKALRRLRWKLDPESDGQPVAVGVTLPKYEIPPDADLSVLTPREREIVLMRVRDGRKLADVGAELGCSDNHVSQVTKRAMRKLMARAAS